MNLNRAVFAKANEGAVGAVPMPVPMPTPLLGNGVTGLTNDASTGTVAGAEVETTVREFDGFKIESNIPFPEKTSGGRGGTEKYPFSNLNVGESFTISDKTKKTIGSTVSSVNKRSKVDGPDGSKVNGKFFVAADLDSGGVRIWRKA